MSNSQVWQVIAFAILALGLLAAGPVWSFFGPFFDQASIRYTVNLTIDTGQGVVTASSVHQNDYRDSPFSGTSMPDRTQNHYGQAAVVQEPGGPTLVGLMVYGRSDAGFDSLFDIICLPKSTSSKQTLAHVRAFRGRCNLDPAKLTLLAFSNPADYRSVRLLGQGSGFRITSAWIEVTDLPLSGDILGQLPWMQTFDPESYATISRLVGFRLNYRAFRIAKN